MKRLILSIIALAVSASPLAASVRYVQLTPVNSVITLDPTDIVEILAYNEAGFPQITFSNGHQFEPTGSRIVSHIYTGIIKIESRNRAMTLKLTGKKDVAEHYVTITPGQRFVPNPSDLIQIVGAQPDSARNHQITFVDGSQHEDRADLSMSQIFTNVRLFDSPLTLTSLKVTPQGTGTATEKNTANIAALEERMATTEADVSKNVTAIAENGTGIAANVSSIATNSATIADHELDILQNRGIGLETAADIARNSTTIADHEERITQNRGIGLETAASIAVNSTSIQDIATSVTTIATSVQDNATGIAANANTLRTHDLSIEANLVGANRSLRNEARLETHDLWIEANRIAHRQSLRDIESNANANTENSTTIQGIATSIETIGTSIQDNATAIIANGTGIQDVVTSIEKIGASVQDNATSIATNGAAIAGNRTSTQEIAAGVVENGTSIQGVATGIETIAKNVQDNAIGIAANASSIAGNTTSIQDNTTGVDANVMLIGGNLSKIQLINQNIEGINRDLDLGKNERGRNVLEIGKNQLRFQALENQIGSLGSDAAFIQKLGDEFATKDDLTTAISEGKTQGINAVTSDPNNWNVFTADQIQEMAVGDLVLTREENGDFVLNYEIQQSDNAKDWTTYSAQAETITGLPVNKAFVRIRTR